jgi:hypothetical protein
LEPDKEHIPELILDIARSKKSAPLDLKRLLYKGGAGTRLGLVHSHIHSGALGRPLHQRFKLVTRAYDVMAGKLAGGGSPVTATRQFEQLCKFFEWAERAEISLELSSVQTTYLHWTDHLLQRQNVERSLNQESAYTCGRIVGTILDEVLERQTPVIKLTRLKKFNRRNSAQSVESEKQSLTSTFAFGRLLQDICDGLPLSAVWGPRPLRIPLKDGGQLVCLSRLASEKLHSVSRTAANELRNLKQRASREAAYMNSCSPNSRRDIVNLRIMSEMLIFIGQTGMNLAQTNMLQLRKFSYAADIDGYKVKEYKPRRGGEVLFEIFKEYRSHFERYLEWRRALFPNDTRVFPVIRNRNTLEKARPNFELVQTACRQACITWIPPSVLRCTRVNWLLRRSGDPDLTAEMAQHSKQTLLRTYAKPSMQRSISEVPSFWLKTDPKLSKLQPLIAVAPGACSGTPLAVSSIPKFATSPDCIRPSGCLWCEHHREIDSLDYVWALASFRHLKTVELSKYYPPAGMSHTDHPSHVAVLRMSEKLAWFRNSNATRNSWVDEALARVNEGRYHPEWQFLIESIE